MNEGMTEYTKWWIAHPWHTTKGLAVPSDCDCEWCVEQRAKQEFQAALVTYYWNKPGKEQIKGGVK